MKKGLVLLYLLDPSRKAKLKILLKGVLNLGVKWGEFILHLPSLVQRAVASRQITITQTENKGEPKSI